MFSAKRTCTASRVLKLLFVMEKHLLFGGLYKGIVTVDFLEGMTVTSEDSDCWFLYCFLYLHVLF